MGLKNNIKKIAFIAYITSFLLAFIFPEPAEARKNISGLLYILFYIFICYLYGNYALKNHMSKRMIRKSDQYASYSNWKVAWISIIGIIAFTIIHLPLALILEHYGFISIKQ